MIDATTTPDLAPDGRRQRAERSRQQIVEALFVLVRGGDLDPSAAKVAEQANVSLRTVFRHFEEMDSLYREMAAQMEAEFLPRVEKPLLSDTWQEKILEHAARRAGLFDEIMPLRVCASARRFHSPYLMEDYERFVAAERSAVDALLPPNLLADDSLAAAFDTALSFETWRRLRQDRRLTRAKALASVEAMLGALIRLA